MQKLEKAYRWKPSDQSRSVWQKQFSNQRVLLQNKLVAYWTAAIDACDSNLKALWSKLQMLLQPSSDGRTQLTADDFARHFATKIEKIRASTASSLLPTVDDCEVEQLLSDLSPMTADS